ncbi:MAG: protein kinase [Planctomycetes bacterium]|nr:protein kinase [Planctomycetota bacterium]
MSCETVRPLLPGLVVLALEDGDAAAAAEHLAGCAACAAERDLLAGLLAVDVEEAPPAPDDVWERIEAAIGRDLVAAETDELPPVEEPPSADAPAPKKVVVVPPRPAPLEDDPFAVGPYTPLEVISAGAMGVVFRARHRESGEVVALKVLHEELARSPLHVRRFRQEAQALAALEHPGIVPVRAVGQSGGQHYIAMGLVEGEPLDAHVARGERWPVDRVLKAVAALGRAVQHAHAQGVVHRDLKPGNVLVGEAGEVVVADFGLATQVADRWASGAGEVTGTPHFMAPEQVRGEPVDRRADVWSLGVILYLLLTHELPFPGDAAVDVQQRVLDDEPTPPRRLDPRVEPALEGVVLRALEKDPAHRYASAAEVAQDLERLLRGERVADAAPPRARRWRPERSRARRLVLGALSGVVVASGVAALGARSVQARAALEQEAARALREHQAEADRVLAEARAGLAQVAQGLDEARAALDGGDPGAALFQAGQARGRVDEVEEAIRRAALGGMASEKLVERARALRREADLVLARAQAALGRPAEAAQVLRRVLADDAFALPLWRELARLEARAGQRAAARVSIDEALRLAPDDPDAWVELARLELEGGGLAPAERALGAALDRDPRRADALLLRAAARLARGDALAAERDARRATELAPDDGQAWLALGRIEHTLGRLDDAVDSLLEAGDLGAGVEALCALALARLDAGRLEEAARDLRRALEAGAGPRARIALGMALEADLDEDGALEVYEAAASEGEGADAGLALARSALLHLHRADEARCLHEAETRLLDERRGPPRLDELMLAAARLQVRRVERARAALAAAQRLAPAEPLVALARARLALADDDVGGAVSALRAAEALAPAAPVGVVGVPGAPPPPRADVSWPVLDPPAALEHERRCLLGEALLRQDGDLRDVGREFELAARADPTGGWTIGGVSEIDRRVGLSPGVAAGLRARARPATGARQAGWLAARAATLESPRRWTRGRLEQASRAWALVSARAPRDAAVWLRRAELAREARRWDEAVMLLDRARALDPAGVEGRLLEAQLFGVDLPLERDAATGRPVHVRDVARAEDALAGLGVAGALVRARVRLAAPADRPGRTEALRATADELVSRVHRALPGTSSPDEVRRRRLDAQAATALLVEVRRALGEPGECALVRSVGALAAQHLAAGRDAPPERLLEALAELDVAAALAPDDGEARWERARALLRLGSWLDGMLELCRAIRLDPARFERAFRPANPHLDLRRAIAAVDDRLAHDPADADAHFCRGALRLVLAWTRRDGRLEVPAGAEDATAALRLAPDFHAARLLRALLRLESGDLDDALEDAAAVGAAAPDAAAAWFVEGSVWARRADVPGLEQAEVARRHALARERLDAARARGLDEGWIKNDKAFDGMRRAGTLGP